MFYSSCDISFNQAQLSSASSIVIPSFSLGSTPLMSCDQWVDESVGQSISQQNSVSGSFKLLLNSSAKCFGVQRPIMIMNVIHDFG